MKSSEYDIVIIGGGCIGASILHELQRLGLKNIALIDKGGKTKSATSQSGGMLRVFHESPKHIEYALLHHQLLKNYQDKGIITGKSIFNGNLYFFHKNRLSSYRNNLEQMRKANYPFQVLSKKEGNQIFPQYSWGIDEYAIFEPLAQQHSPTLFVEDLLNDSNKKNIDILKDFEVQRICLYRNIYRVSSQESFVTARCLILAGGARLLPRLSDLGLSLNLESRNLSVFNAKKHDENFILPSYFDRETLDFGLFGKSPEVVLASPDSNRLVQKEWELIFNKKSADDCYSPNRQGVIGQIPGYDRLLMATGWGGTGFKFSLAIGQYMGQIVNNEFNERKNFYA